MTAHWPGPPKELGPDATRAEANQQVSDDTTTTADNTRQTCCVTKGRDLARSGKFASQASPIPAVGPVPDVAMVFVGTLLWSAPAHAARMLQIVADDDLESVALSAVVATVRALSTAGRPVDPQSVMDELRRDGRVRSDVALALMHATTAGAVPQAAQFYAAAVVAEALRRRVESAGHTLKAATQDAVEADLAPLASRLAAGVTDCAARLAKLRGETA